MDWHSNRLQCRPGYDAQGFAELYGTRYGLCCAMTTKRLKRPRDPIALAKLIGDIATGQVEDKSLIKKKTKRRSAKKLVKPRQR
jgi:hypothetical protein